MMSETVVFNADGSGLITSRSGMRETSTRAFEWYMQSPGRLVMRYCKGENDDNGSEETAEAVDQFEIEIRDLGNGVRSLACHDDPVQRCIWLFMVCSGQR